MVDETGFVKKGNRSAGVARQSLGHREADRELPNRSVSRLRHPGRAHLVDRELYLPQAWTDDRGRCTQAGVPAEVGFATNPELPIRADTKQAPDAAAPPPRALSMGGVGG